MLILMLRHISRCLATDPSDFYAIVYTHTYIYIYIIQQFSSKYVAFESTLLSLFTQTITKLDLPTLRNGSIEERTQRNK